MGTAIGNLIQKETISLDSLNRKKVAIDAFNTLYQFLTILRAPDGNMLMDRNGNITSHLNGLLSRSISLMSKGIDLVYVFDGEAPKLKERERERRRKLKNKAMEKYEEAKQMNDIDGMFKYGSRTVSITHQIVEDAKTLINLLGIPYVEAPSEGEAQASFMQKQGIVDYIASQDYDSLLFGADKLIRYLAINPRKKKSNTLHYEKMEPELIYKSKLLNKLNINQEQLIIIGILVGTDFNIGGIKGIGPKKALKLVKEFKDRYDDLFIEVRWNKKFNFDWKEIYKLFHDMPTKEVKLEWRSPDNKGIINFLCEKRDFSIERVNRELNKLDDIREKKKQKGLNEFFSI